MMAKKAAASRKNGAAKPDSAGLGAGNGGETHQVAGKADTLLTTNQGVPISDNQNSLKSGARGPSLLEDFVLREKIPISITSAFRSGSCIRAAPARMASSSRPSRWPS
jgi:hypothetical protein